MTRTEQRLADALDAAARGVREDTLSPLLVPESRRRPRPAWAAPIAAAAALLVVVGLSVTASGGLPGSGGTGMPRVAVPAPDPYYVEMDLDGNRPVVRSTTTGAVTATVPVPRVPDAPEYGLVAPVADGRFFVAAWQPGHTGEKIYRFRLTAAGRISGFSAVPGGILGGPGWSAGAMAASADGSRVAIAFYWIGPGGNCDTSCAQRRQADYIDVVSTQTGAKTAWRGGLTSLGSSFSVGDLSWTADGRELVYLGQWCRAQSGPGTETCPASDGRVSEVRTLNPAAGGGRLDSGRLLLRESARYPYLAQALISPDGSKITAVVLRGAVRGTSQIGGIFPEKMSVEQISVKTGKTLAVLYRTNLGPTTGVNGVPDPVALMPDGSGRNLLLNIGLCSGHCTDGANGWIDHSRLVPLWPADGRLGAEGW